MDEIKQNENFVLVIENNLDHIEIIIKSLQKKGNYIVKTTENLSGAIEIISSNFPHLILTDLQLPDGNVFDLINSIEFRTHCPTTSSNNLPVIVMTSQGDEQTAVELMKIGILDYIVKSKESFENIGKTINLAKRHWNQAIQQSKTEKALLESEQKYRLITENISDVIWTTDINLKFTFVSTSVTKTTGYESEELVGKSVLEFLAPESLVKVQKVIDSLFTQKNIEPIVVELEINNKDGSISSVEISFRILETEANTLIGLIGVLRDISSRQKTKETIRMLNMAVEQSPVSIIITDPNGKIEYVNPKFIDITGYTAEEAIGQNPRILKSGEKPDIEYKKLWDTITNGETWRGEFHNKKKNGEFYWEQATISPVRDSTGNIAHFIAIKEDITKIKEANTQLVQSEEKFRQLSENISHVFWLADKNSGKILYISPVFEELWGIPLEKGYKDFTAWIQVIHPNDKEKVIEEQYKLIYKNELFAEEYRIIRPDGSIRWIWSRVYPVPDENGNTYRYAGIAEDITLRKQVEDELRKAMQKAEESDKLKTAFLANISHEIRTPMNGILGFTELMCREDTSHDKRLYFADVISRSTNQLLTVVDDILDLARIETGQLNIIKSNTNLQVVFNEVISQFKPQIVSKGVEIIEDYNIDENKIIYTDKTRIKQILSNLIANATKFTLKGKIKTGISKNLDSIQCYVEDTGIGIPENKKHLIFGRFQQADFEHSRLYGGAGIGLAISKSLTELLGGKMWYKSEEGKGSTFYFTLPDNEIATDTIQPAFSSKQKTEKDNNIVTILAAEDENLNYLLIADIFEGTNVKLIHAHDGAEAIELCHSNPEIQLVLMDIKMPITNGFEASQKIKEFRPQMPIIAITACFTDEDKAQALSSGCSDYMAKPIKIDNFFKIVNKYVTVKMEMGESG